MSSMVTRRSYTPTQRDWMKDRACLRKFRSKTGRIRTEKLAKAFERKFGEVRSRGGFGHTVRVMLGREKRKYTKRTPVKRKEMTFGECETRLKGMLTMIETIKSFIT